MEAIIAVFWNCLIIAGGSNQAAVDTDTIIKKEIDTHTRYMEVNNKEDLKARLLQSNNSGSSKDKIEVWEDPEPEPEPILN